MGSEPKKYAASPSVMTSPGPMSAVNGGKRMPTPHDTTYWSSNLNRYLFGIGFFWGFRTTGILIPMDPTPQPVDQDRLVSCSDSRSRARLGLLLICQWRAAGEGPRECSRKWEASSIKSRAIAAPTGPPASPSAGRTGRKRAPPSMLSPQRSTSGRTITGSATLKVAGARSMPPLMPRGKAVPAGVPAWDRLRPGGRQSPPPNGPFNPERRIQDASADRHPLHTYLAPGDPVAPAAPNPACSIVSDPPYA